MERLILAKSIDEAIKIQKELSKKISLKCQFKSLNQIKKIAACDVHTNGKVICAIAVFGFPSLNLIEQKRMEFTKPRFPYIPGLLAFREGEYVIETFKQISNRPDILIFDGHGVAHPRGCGIASHIGVLLDMPTIGCAKEILCGEYKVPRSERGNYEYIYLNNKRVGVVLRTKSNVKPVFVSPGHKIDVKLAKEVILACSKKYRIPEPLRHAHMLTRNSEK